MSGRRWSLLDLVTLATLGIASGVLFAGWGILWSSLSPLFAAVLPQFVDIDGGNVTAQLLFMGLVFCVLAFISDGTWGLLAGTARQWLATDARRLEGLRATGGIVMIVLGILVLISAVVSS